MLRCVACLHVPAQPISFCDWQLSWSSAANQTLHCQLTLTKRLTGPGGVVDVRFKKGEGGALRHGRLSHCFRWWPISASSLNTFSTQMNCSFIPPQQIQQTPTAAPKHRLWTGSPTTVRRVLCVSLFIFHLHKAPFGDQRIRIETCCRHGDENKADEHSPSHPKHESHKIMSHSVWLFHRGIDRVLKQESNTLQKSQLSLSRKNMSTFTWRANIKPQTLSDALVCPPNCCIGATCVSSLRGKEAVARVWPEQRACLLVGFHKTDRQDRQTKQTGAAAGRALSGKVNLGPCSDSFLLQWTFDRGQKVMD